MSASIDYDSACESSSLTPSKIYVTDSVDNMENGCILTYVDIH